MFVMQLKTRLSLKWLLSKYLHKSFEQRFSSILMRIVCRHWNFSLQLNILLNESLQQIFLFRKFLFLREKRTTSSNLVTNSIYHQQLPAHAIQSKAKQFSTLNVNDWKIYARRFYSNIFSFVARDRAVYYSRRKRFIKKRLKNKLSNLPSMSFFFILSAGEEIIGPWGSRSQMSDSEYV